MATADRQKAGNGTKAVVRREGATSRAAPNPQPAIARSRRLVLPKELYENVLAGREHFLIRPIMNIHGEMRPVPTRARAQGGHGGLLWAFFPRGINSDEYQLRSCPYGDPNDVLLITTTDPKDLPVTASILESYPHRIKATTEQILEKLAPSYWARTGSLRNFYEQWQREFGRGFKLAQEPWAWVIRIEPPSQRPMPVPNGTEIRRGLLGRLKLWGKGRSAQKTPAAAPTRAVKTPGLDGPKPQDKTHEQLVVAQKNALVCLENAIKARRDGRMEQAWRLMDVAHRILDRAIEKTG